MSFYFLFFFYAKRVFYVEFKKTSLLNVYGKQINSPHLIRGDAKVFNTINVYTKGKFVFNMQV